MLSLNNVTHILQMCVTADGVVFRAPMLLSLHVAMHTQPAAHMAGQHQQWQRLLCCLSSRKQCMGVAMDIHNLPTHRQVRVLIGSGHMSGGMCKRPRAAKCESGSGCKSMAYHLYSL